MLSAAISLAIVIGVLGLFRHLNNRAREDRLLREANPVPRAAAISPFTGDVIATGSEPLSDAALRPNNDGHAGYTRGNTEGLPLY